MKVESRDSKEERRVLIGMIVDPLVLSRLASKWDKDNGLFYSQWSNIIANWCVKHFLKYGKAPGKHIEDIFEQWASASKDKTTTQLVSSFLSGLSGEYESLQGESNTEYVLDVAGRYFNEVRLGRLIQAVQDDLEDKKVDQAYTRLNTFGRLEIGAGAGVDVLTDETAIKEAFQENLEPLVHYRGALANFFGNALERDAFVSFMGPEKRGKTWWLLDLAWRAMVQGKRVAFFEVGDMSQNQIMRRWMIRVSKHPLTPKTIKFPRFIEREPHEKYAKVDLEEIDYDQGLSWEMAWKACQGVIKKLGGNQSLLKLSVHPNSTLSVHGVRTILQTWEREGWVPDVIVVDYADILAPPQGIVESRDQINATWKGLRALSQSFHCLVVTATQSDAASYKQDLLGRTNFTDDKRKFAHVTGMVGLNSSREEKEYGLMRLNWLVLRESEFSEDKCVHVAGCLDVGNPAVLSCF